jgi:carbon-monoxide dehydrogenase small subunit
MGHTITLQVNGKSVTREVEPQTTLSEFIREGLRLTGTHIGCDTSQCGACTVHVDGRAVKSCNMLAVQTAGRAVTTIEGLAAADGTLHPMQAAFKTCHGLQCGFCTPGMVMSAVDLVRHPGGQHLSLHRLSQHRQGRAARRGGHDIGSLRACREPAKESHP